MHSVTPRNAACQLKVVYPASELWVPYICWCVSYVTQEWPSVLEDTSPQAFRRSYEQNLLQQLKEGGRYLMFCVRSGEKVGIANLYTAPLQSLSGQPKDARLTLHVAEFQVATQLRRQGVGRQFLQSIQTFARELGCRWLSVEVDFDKSNANAFWASVMGTVAVQRNRRSLFETELSE